MIILYLLGLGIIIGMLKAAYHGLYDGWHNTTKYRHKYIPPDYNDMDDMDDIQDDYSSHDEEIALLEIAIERRKEAALILEHELEHCTDAKKRVTLITRLNTLDKQTFKDMQRIEKLRDS